MQCQMLILIQMVINFILYVNGWYWVFYLDKELYKFPGQGEGRLTESSHDGGHVPEFYSSVTALNSFTLRACSSSVSVHMLEKMLLSFAISLFFVSKTLFFFSKKKRQLRILISLGPTSCLWDANAWVLRCFSSMIWTIS